MIFPSRRLKFGAARAHFNAVARYRLLAVLGILCLVLSILTHSFATRDNLITIARQISINGILAVGVTYVLLTGGVDLSLGSVAALAGIAAALFARHETSSLFLAIAVGIGTGLICGLINGSIITLGRVPPFISTLGMLTAARGLALRLSDGRPVAILIGGFNTIGSGQILRIPYLVLILLAVALISHVVLRHMLIGRYIYAVGGNERAAVNSGVNVNRVKLLAYAICGACAGLGGLVLASRIRTGQPNAALGYELDAIAAVVIGGTSLSGGFGGIGGTLLGALVIGVIINGLDLLNVSPYYRDIIKGCIIIGAVLLDRRGKV